MNVIVDVHTPLQEPNPKCSKREYLRRKCKQVCCEPQFLLGFICCCIVSIFLIALLIVNELEFSKTN